MKWISVKDRLPEEDQMVLAYEPMWKTLPEWCFCVYHKQSKRK